MSAPASASSPPLAELPEVAAFVETDDAVHLVVRIEHDWDTSREAAVAEFERKCDAAEAYAGSAAFRARFGSRIGVVRAQSPRPAPSIVTHLLEQRGVEFEDLSAPAAEPGERCASCGRTGLRPEQAQMTDRGWACPACARAFWVRSQPRLAKPPRRLPRLPLGVYMVLIAVTAILFVLFFYRQLQLLNHTSGIIRQHMPRQ